jgi:hypothetical protein
MGQDAQGTPTAVHTGSSNGPPKGALCRGRRDAHRLNECEAYARTSLSNDGCWAQQPIYGWQCKVRSWDSLRKQSKTVVENLIP